MVFFYVVLLKAVLLCMGNDFSHIPFPPNIKKLDSNHQVDGKRPFGWQRPPDGPVTEYNAPLKGVLFWQLHVKDKLPLVYRGVVKTSKAIEAWTDAYLTENYGNLDVLVEHKKEDRSSSSGRMKLKSFIREYHDKDLYVVSMFPSEMMKDVKAVPSILCGTFRNYSHESNLWMSNGGTRSVIHYDADHNFHCVINGRKDFIMIPNNITTKTNLYFRRKNPNFGSGFSFLDPDSIDLKKFPRVAKVPWTYATLHPGDCIYIPAKYIHQVRGYGRTIAATTLFTSDINFEFFEKDCNDDEPSSNKTMADINFLWTYKKGDKIIDMGYYNTEHVKGALRKAMAKTEKGKLSKMQFVEECALYFPPLGRNKQKMGEVWDSLFELKEDEYLTTVRLDEITVENMKSFCRALDEPHGIVTNGTEHVFVLPGEKIVEKHYNPSREKFLTEGEKLWNSIAKRDPMFDYLTPKEKEEYVSKNKERLGSIYSQDDGLSSNYEYIPWTIRDLPEQYHDELCMGTIPRNFKEEFISLLPDHVSAKHVESLNNYLIPLEVCLAICPKLFRKFALSNKVKVIKEKLLAMIAEKIKDSKSPEYEQMYEQIISGTFADGKLEKFILDNKNEFKKDVDIYKRIIKDEL